jgi:proline iminopeptidase
MAKALPRGSHLHCPNGSHMAMVDDQVVYIQGLIDFLRRVDAQAIREDP